jgi:hypothetical protein
MIRINPVENNFGCHCYRAYLGLEKKTGAIHELYVDFKKAYDSFRRELFV